MPKYRHVNLNLFYGYKCNYSCHGCVTNSDTAYHQEDDPDLNQLMSCIPILASLFEIDSMITLLGGEAFLYWDKRIVPLALEVNKHFPKTRINIFSNGQLLPRYIDKFIDLSNRVDNVALEITQHLGTLAHTKPGQIWHQGIRCLDNHSKIKKISDLHYHVIGNTQANIYLTPVPTTWTMSLRRLPDGRIKPHATNDPTGSMQHGCSAGSVCAIVNEGRLYKCALLATLKKSLERRGQVHDPDWKKYLDYKSIDLFNFNAIELEQHMESYGKPIAECDMCSNRDDARVVSRTYDMIFRR